MDFHALLAKMQELDRPTTQPVQAEECGMMPPTSMPVTQPGMASKPETPPPSMSVNLNAQGMDNIESMMKLFQKVNPDMMPKTSPSAMVTSEPNIASISPSLSPLKMLPDFDADNDNMPGGEMDIDLPPDHDQDHEIVKTLDKDGDGDHDMDDHELDSDDKDIDDVTGKLTVDMDGDRQPDLHNKKEAWANEPNEEEKNVDYMVNKLAGGMNKSHGTYPKVADGDNPMQKITRMGESELQTQIRNELRKRLAEAKGAK